MEPGDVNIQSRFVNALRTQASHKAGSRLLGPLPCPYCHEGRIFQDIDQLLGHVRNDHSAVTEGLSDGQARRALREVVMGMREYSQSVKSFAGGNVTPDIGGLNLDSDKERQTSPSGKKRPADSEFRARRGKVPSHVEIVDPDFPKDKPHTISPEKLQSRSQHSRLYNQKKGVQGVKSPQPITSGSNFNHSNRSKEPQKQPDSQANTRQPGLIELQKYDPRFPGLLLQPDSRPITQEQLASEVKSIYAGLTMVETKCIHVDRGQATAPQDNKQLAPDHWQALIALHRTLLHEHHDFFLASQHPSASPALRRLAAKYTMPARMWKHGIHSFLELLRQRLPMMALLYETVPAFEDTWIECLGDLGRYRMAIEDEDIKDRETWANVARSWYSKAADKNPTVGRLYHHLAILARPNALQQMYYYARSLTSVETFSSARDSIMTLLGPVIKQDQPAYSSSPLVDTSFITAHAHIFTRNLSDKFLTGQADFLNQLDNQIGRVTAKWKEQGVYTAVTNIAGWFNYGVETNTLRLIFELRARQRKHSLLTEEQITAELSQLQNDKPKITEREIPSAVEALLLDDVFVEAVKLTNKTLALVLRRIGDKNVLPHVHVMLSFISTLASIDYVASLINEAPWADLVPFLNTLTKIENQQNHPQEFDTSLTEPIFPVSTKGKSERDELPLPEDYLVRGLIWAEEYFPQNWFQKEHDEEERYLELASTAKCRAERVLRLGHYLASSDRWLSYDKNAHTFSVAQTQALGPF